MRPHRLRVTAFGAFGGTVEVCFDDLASAGLFLLHGETGAGKTTLLDAIAFALYGQVPGERGKARRLRSDHAPPGTRTEVQLEATMGGRRMRITRRPEQQRPKLRGGGTTTEPAKILLEEFGITEWRAVSTRAGEADDEIKDLMGMSAAQFYQVVLLPQGQFAQFLHADVKDRERLLQKLFGTDRFRAVEDWLAERRRTTARAVAEAELAIRELAARVAQVADAVPADAGPIDAGPIDAVPADAVRADAGPADAVRADAGPAHAGPADAGPTASQDPAASRDPAAPPDPAWAARLAETAAAAAQAAKSLVRTQVRTLDRAQARYREAERLADRQRRRAEAVRARDELAAAEAGMDILRRELASAARAAEVAGSLTEAERAGQALDQAHDEQAKAMTNAQVRAGADPGDTAAELRAAGREHVARLGRLDALRPVQREAADEDQNAQTAREAADALSDRVAGAQMTLAARRQQRPALAAERDRAREAGQDLPAQQQLTDACRRAADDADALVRARTDKRRQEEAYVAARLETSDLRDEASRLREARIDGMRAELAATLVDGTPCPVCGSLDHPELCELRGERVTREQEEAADAAAAAAADQAEMIGAKLAAADILVADLTVRLEEAGFAAPRDLPTLEVDAARLAVRAKAAAAGMAKAAKTAARLSEIQAELDALDQDIAGTAAEIAELTEQRDAELRRAAEAEQRAARHRKSLRAQLDGAADLDSAQDHEREAADALIAAAEATEAVARADAAACGAQDRAQVAAAAAGFADPGSARKAQRPPDWRNAADQEIRDHDASAKAAAELLADPELDVPIDPPADVAGAQAAVEEARKAHDDALAAHDRARHKAEQLADLAPKVAKSLSDLRPVTARADEARALADLAAGLGANALRMTLSAFVLAARLEEVAVAASERLLKMTSGRYSLIHTDARRGAGRSGLGLLVCDAWTGLDRDTSTLSGGETFLASLALALGLADVVTAEAGGTRIEALFVDEGFGSLDEDTLEEVMTVLDSLREGGRMVGIVSHVAELKQRIPAQVRVHKGRSGSHLTVCGQPA
jgi:DNA repair protein SbcC/Rad50